MLVNWHEDFQIFTDQSKISASSRLRVGLKLKRLRCHLATSLKEKTARFVIHCPNQLILGLFLYL